MTKKKEPPNKPRAITEAVAEVSEQMGIDANLIRVLRDTQWEKMKEGVLIKLTVGRWRARHVLAADDLALDAEYMTRHEQLLELGTKYLLDKQTVKRLDAIESSARKSLTNLSFQIHWGTFVPSSAYADVRDMLESYREKYFAERDALVGNYETIKREIADQHYALALDSLTKTMPDEPIEELEEKAVEACDKLMEHFPSKQALHDSFVFRWSVSYIPLPTMLAQDQLLAAQLRAEELVEVERARTVVAEEEGKRRAAHYKAEAEIQAAYAELRAKESAADAYQRNLDAMHADVINQMRAESAQLIEDFLGQTKRQIAQTIFDAATNVLAAIQGKTLHRTHKIQLETLIKKVSRLNLFEDADVDAMLARLTSELAGKDVKTLGASGDLSEVLHDISVVTMQSLISLGADPRASRNDKVMDFLPDAVLLPDATRQSRHRLGLEDDLSPGLTATARGSRQI